MTKLVVIGFDAPIPQRVYELAARGELPNIANLIRNGVFAENCLVPFPTITPPNWTTIVTGAWPGTHGITDFHMHKPGMPLNRTYQAFDSRDCLSEFIWEAAEREGKISIVINWPSSWPPRVKEGYHVGGAGLALNEWRTGEARYVVKVALAGAQVYTTEENPLAVQMPPIDVRGIKIRGCVMAAKVPLVYSASLYDVKGPREMYAAVVRRNGGYEAVLLDEGKEKVLARVGEGEWSGNIVVRFDTAKGAKRGGFRVKGLSISKRGLSILFTPIASLDPEDFPAYPEGVIGELVKEPEKMPGLPLPSHTLFRLLNMGLIDIDTWLEGIDIEHRWLAYATCRLMKERRWDLFFMHAHCPDWAYHAFMGKLYEAKKSGSKELMEYFRAEVEFYKSLDRMVGSILECSGEDTLNVIVSDHGAKSSSAKRPSVMEILKRAGLASYEVDPDTGALKSIDWSRTKAWPQRAVYIYVNLKGRDPDGIVDPEEYEDVRTQIIDALYSYVDPETGRRPILFAIRKEDARILGLYGDRIGDVIYALNPEFRGEHGTFLPTAEHEIGSLRGLLIISGPGVKRGVVLKRNVWLTDIVPTVCHILDLPVPRDAEGGIIYQALEDPDFKLKELKRLRDAVAKLRRALEGERHLTHEYE